MSLVLGPLLAACDPSDFDALTRKRDAAAGGEAGRDGGREGSAGESGRGAGRAGNAGSAAGMDAGPDAAAPLADASMDAALEDGAPPSEAGSPECPRVPDPAAVRIRGTELGAVQIPGVGPPSVAMTARVGTHMLWLFGGSGSPEISAWVAWSGVTPPASPPALDVPLPIDPLFPAEAVPPERTAIPTGVVTVSDSEALIYFASGFFFSTDDIGLARIRFDERRASVVHPAGQLFPYRQTMPPIWIPLFGTGTFAHEEQDGTYIYVYACNANPDAPDEQQGGVHESPCRIARVLREHAGDGTRYRYWNGSAWVSDHQAASIVLDHVPTLLTVSFNRYLQKFLAVHSHGLLDRIVLRWADRPEGPWHILGHHDTLDATGTFPFTIVGVVEHPGLRDTCAQTIYVSYILPLLVTEPPGDQTVLEHHMIQIELE